MIRLIHLSCGEPGYLVAYQIGLYVKFFFSHTFDKRWTTAQKAVNIAHIKVEEGCYG
jgi:hypothetical protein